MNFTKGMMITLDGIDCCVLDIQVINGFTYLYVAEIVDDDITESFYVYKVSSKEKVERITNSIELKNLLPVFIKSLEESL